MTKIYVGHSRAIIGLDQALVMSTGNQIVSARQVEKLIRLIRGHKVMLDADLAQLYGVQTRVFIQAVKRNSSRFPADFMFPLSSAEAKVLRSQTVISNNGRGGRHYLPFVFTEQA